MPLAPVWWFTQLSQTLLCCQHFRGKKNPGGLRVVPVQVLLEVSRKWALSLGAMFSPSPVDCSPFALAWVRPTSGR